jgi:HD-GYP domain-containing protein (c-di-GMP phosphodiesterase class II)
MDQQRYHISFLQTKQVMLSTIVERASMAQNQKIVGFNLLLSLSGYIDSRVSPTGWHSFQVASLVKGITGRLNFDARQTQSIYWAALLHDVGKVGVPDKILCKPGPLDDREWQLMRLHPLIGANIVKNLSQSDQIAPVINFHQERYDGSGYPEGLQGDQIPFGARILAVLDAYEAMTSDRVYRKALRHKKAVDEICTMSGKDFDPVVIDAFLDSVKTLS